MSKKEKKPRRKKLRYPGPESLAARASGLAINENRRGTLVRLMDTAIREWFFDGDPFAIHLLVCASYMVLADLGQKSGTGPVFEKDHGRFSMTAVYDFLRHAKPGMLNDSVDLPPVVNEWMLFDAIGSFQRLFNGTTARMRTFQAYYVVQPSSIHPKRHERASVFLPGGITLEEAERLDRVEFFLKLAEMFAAEIQTEAGLRPGKK